MIFFLFITFQIFYFASCSISCYKTPFDTDWFNYTVTADHIPAKLPNTSVETNSVVCYISVAWLRDPDRTQIVLFALTDMNVESTRPQLDVAVGYQMKITPSVAWTKQIIYQCDTDRCNNLSQLKPLLSALVVNDSLHELEYLLKPIQPFHGEWCYQGKNTTVDNCNTTIPVSLCKQCDLFATMSPIGPEYCATCLTDDPSDVVLFYQNIFNMTDRTNASDWEIRCGRDGCNTLAIGDSIRKRAYVNFNFTQFLNNETAISSLNTMPSPSFFC